MHAADRARHHGGRLLRLAPLALALAGLACGSVSVTGWTQGAGSDFERRIPRPPWWDDVAGPVFADAEEATAFNQRKSYLNTPPDELLQHNRTVYKRCYRSILAHPDDEPLVVSCLSTMANFNAGDSVALRRYLLEHYFDHRIDVDGCIHCMPGDLIADHARLLAESYSNRGETGDGIRWLEKALDERADETSPWQQARMYATLARLYLAEPLTPARRERVRAARSRLREQARTRSGMQRWLDEFEEQARLIDALP